MQRQLNGVKIHEVSKFLAENPSETTHGIELVNSFDAAHPFIILIQLSSVIAEYENDDITMIHLTLEEPPWDPSTNEYSKRETPVIDHGGQVSIPAKAAR